MNQYDLKPLTRQEIRQMQRIAVGFAAFVVLLLVLVLGGCTEKEQPPTIDEQLQGPWEWRIFEITHRYNFHEGACDIYAIVPAQSVQYYAYAYQAAGDTLKMFDLAGGDRTVFAVAFPTDSTATLERLDGLVLNLVRIR